MTSRFAHSFRQGELISDALFIVVSAMATFVVVGTARD